MTKFEEGTNILVRYNEEFVKSGVFFSLFFSQKWRAREILFDVTRNSLKTMFVKTRVHCIIIWRVFMWKRKKKKSKLSVNHIYTWTTKLASSTFDNSFLQLAFFHWMKITHNSSTLHSRMWKQLFPWVSASQPLITCSKLTEETLEQGKRYGQS